MLLTFCKRACAAALSLVLTGQSTSAQEAITTRRPTAATPSAGAPAITPDPAVVYGQLPNGMRYALLRATRPYDGVSIRLHVRVGSLDEADDERGAAHFVEHMAFNGTRQFAEDELETRFSAAGIAFGRDQNAWTSYEGTQYSADIALATPEKLDLVFHWLADTAYGQLFEPGAVERERPVVVAEHDRRLGPQLSSAEAVEAFRSPELLTTKRSPIGTRDSIRAVTPAQLAAFHKRWYRPDNAFVVIVADLPVAEMERRVRETFGPWRAEGPAPARAVRGKPNLNRGLDVLVRAEPSAPTTVQACRVRPPTPDPGDTVERRRTRLLRGLWQAALNERIARLARSGTAGVLTGSLSYQSANDEADYVCLTAAPLGDDWRSALTTAVTELRRLQAHGVTKAEVDRVLAGVRTAQRTAVSTADNRTQILLAEQLAGDLAENDVFETPAEALRIFEEIAPTLTPQAVDAAMRAETSGAGPLIVVVGPTVPTTAAVQAAWRAAEAAPAPTAYAEAAAGSFPYTDFGPPGRVVERTEIADPGFTRLRFANGLVVNFKSLAAAKDQVAVLLTFGEGRREVAPADLDATRMATSAFTAGGTKRMSAEDIATALAGRRFGLNLGVSDNAYSMAGSTTAEDLQLQLQVIGAYLTEPGFRPEFEASYRAIVDLLFRQTASSPEQRAAEALAETIAKGTPDDKPDRDKLLKLTSRDFARVLTPALSTAPLELTIVGDIDEAAATAAIAGTLGALPPRAPREAKRPDAWFHRFPKDWPEVVRVRHSGAKDRAVVMVVWPLYVADPARRREERAIDLLSQVFDARLRRRTREALGQTYAPSAGTRMPDFADQGRFNVVVQTSPADAEAVLREIRAVAAGLATGQGLDQAALDAERRAVLDRASSRKLGLNWWIGALAGSAENDQNLRDQLDWESEYRSLTPEEVKKAAADWLTGKPVAVIALPE